ncbi:hypothetical protein WJ0W_005593 [Paenibacillus melissococcoides]|uniref:Xylose isomerase-like TIM barrel domain-containing protein n=1 Tax=Paenibacillus melissococcoides TaxID=2912268 RepID=A0ABM9G8P2_9BACL|nr:MULTISPECIES: hypothetical protein [Paenibacillus]MEB9896614.1 hypothetical protein [Bacillus cereus]CAH8248336.1 hypothetical protein WJ0W_005593 [Paenibacillus melissococcoides]CAH8717790.1 hypothetical protein HTL2_005059 [Paenibacillus melissococcoides]CAH8719331.1 hypothetical protein WDD9_005513 [Paenibacillus melissococcoides]GIO77137.1 hypothetical protein J6TS7_07470 [Paenibacillus dendritiformis]
MSEAHSPWKLGTYWYDKESGSLLQLKEAGIACIELNLDNSIPPEEALTPAMLTRYQHRRDGRHRDLVGSSAVREPVGHL